MRRITQVLLDGRLVELRSLILTALLEPRHSGGAPSLGWEDLIPFIPFAFGALLLSTSAYAQPRHHDLSPMRIVIETVDHSKQRYPTVGDWQVKPDGLHITVSKMSDQRYEFLVGMHEVIEAYLAIHAGISPAAVDRFDKAYEARRKPGDLSEPGDDPRAPYHHQHQVATSTEKQLAKQLDVDWAAYDREVSSK